MLKAVHWSRSPNLCNRNRNSPPQRGRTVQITRGWKCKLQLMVRRKPRPYRAAERRQIVATAEGRGRVSFEKSATEWRKSSKESFAPTVLMTHLYRKPRPSAVATICRRSAARIGGASRDILHLTSTVLPQRGGVAATSIKMPRSHLMERTGWSDRRNLQACTVSPN